MFGQWLRSIFASEKKDVVARASSVETASKPADGRKKVPRAFQPIQPQEDIILEERQERAAARRSKLVSRLLDDPTQQDQIKNRPSHRAGGVL